MSPPCSGEPNSKNGHSQNGTSADGVTPPNPTLPVSLRGKQAPSFYSESEMARRIREYEWADTPLGSIEEWPSELGIAVDVMLGAGEAISIYWGPDLLLLYNDAWRPFIADLHPDALGRPARELFPEIWGTIGPRFAHVMDGHGAAFEREQRLTFEREGHLEDTWFDYSFNPIPMADGCVGGVFNIGTEVTDRVETEQALRQSEEFHRLAAEAGNMGTWSVDLETGNAVLSSRMAELMGYAPGEHEAAPKQPEPEHWQQMVSQEVWLASVHPDDRAPLERAIAAAQEHGAPLDLEFRVQHDGETRWLYAMGTVKADGPGDGPRLRGASVDITRRHELEEALVGVSETVRQNIGRELHDVLSSDLAALAIRTDNIVRTLRQGDNSEEEIAEAINGVAQGIRSAANQARDLSHVLMPSALQEETLATALDQLCREQGELGTPAPVFKGNREEPLPADKETATHLYRIAREAILNAQRHAEAEQIWLRLFREENKLVLTVRDDGKGLPKLTGSRAGVGLRTMEHRADLIGGTLRIESPENGGTVVRCELPLSRAEGE